MTNTYQEAIENSNIVSKTDIEGIITFVNEEFCSIFGFSKDELLGKNHNIVRHPDVPKENFRDLWTTIKTKKKPFKSTVKNLTKDGRTVYLNTTITPILDKNDNIIEFIAIRYDVTAEVELKKRLELRDKELELLNKTLEERVAVQTKQLKELNKTLEQRVQKEIEKNRQKEKMLFWQSRLASLGQMLGNIAHQWRQPLTELNLGLFNLKKSFQNNDEETFLEYYNDSKTAITNMSNTIEDFTNFFNPDKEKSAFYIKDAINEALMITRKSVERNEVAVNCSLKGLRIVGVSNELAQVIINLIHNAQEAYIENNIENRRLDISVSEDLHKNFAIISISDAAGGIKDENIDKIFEPYFTTKHKSVGTGLGLFMSKMIIEKGFNGTMNVEQIKDGTKFIITIAKVEDEN